jgi:toxin ParE1/3/4
MALRLVLAPLAEADLDAIAEFIARESPGGAVKMLLRIRAGMTTLLDQPRLGQLVQKPPRTRLRKWTVAPYIVFYRVMDDDLEVVRVLHAARDLDDLLDGLD